MATLRQMIDGSREVFDATLAAHNRVTNPPPRVPRVRERIEASTERRSAGETTQYIYSVAASGIQLQAEYQRGYHDGYRDGVQVNATKTVERRPTPSIPVLQSNREVSLEE